MSWSRGPGTRSGSGPGLEAEYEVQGTNRSQELGSSSQRSELGFEAKYQVQGVNQSQAPGVGGQNQSISQSCCRSQEQEPRAGSHRSGVGTKNKRLEGGARVRRARREDRAESRKWNQGAQLRTWNATEQPGTKGCCRVSNVPAGVFSQTGG